MEIKGKSTYIKLSGSNHDIDVGFSHTLFLELHILNG